MKANVINKQMGGGFFTPARPYAPPSQMSEMTGNDNIPTSDSLRGAIMAAIAHYNAFNGNYSPQARTFAINQLFADIMTKWSSKFGSYNYANAIGSSLGNFGKSMSNVGKGIGSSFRSGLASARSGLGTAYNNAFTRRNNEPAAGEIQMTNMGTMSGGRRTRRKRKGAGRKK